MPEAEIAPHGSWKSPITADLIASRTIGIMNPANSLGEIALDGEDVYWVEARPAEGGRYVVVRHSPGGRKTDITPSSFNTRTRVHELGGGAYAVSEGTVYCSNFADQRLYRLDRPPDPWPITPGADLRFADGVIDGRRGRMICVREDHTVEGQEATNALVSLDLEGQKRSQVLVSGNDFYSSPRLDPDGSRLAWLTWNRPNMPWHGTELWVGELNPDGSLGQADLVAGGTDESIFQPEWSPDGILHFASERTGWWNLYRWQEGGAMPLCQMEAEFGWPQWVFGMSTYAFESADRIVCTYAGQGGRHLAILDTATQELELLHIAFSEIWGVRAAPGRTVFAAGSPTQAASIVQLDLVTRQLELLHCSSDVEIEDGYISLPKAVEFPTEHGLTAHAFFYAPRNPGYVAPAGERPPLVVMAHSGPTGATWTTLRLDIQYFTSRGIAVLDVNYGGSTGYGRAYRQRLDGEWGIVDVEDCINGARYLIERGEVDGERLAIRGGSAGGFTTLCALTFCDVFQVGASYYGVSDLETLEKETHKFESRYLDRLIGPYPERRDLFKERSPINFTERLSRPVIFFQGLEDLVVPPNQAESMVEELRAKGVPVAYVPFEGEQHGFRCAENIERALDTELYFYSTIFGFELADPVEPVHIDGL